MKGRTAFFVQRFRVLLMAAVVAASSLFLQGCLFGTETIKVEYLPGFKADRLFTEYTPRIAVNRFSDERPNADRIGEGYNMYGGKVETWVSDRLPVDIVEEAIIEQLKNSGFDVVKTSGWNLTAESLSDYINADLVMGGKLKAFWVESRPGMLTVSVNSNVTFDLVIADVQEKKIIWAGQFAGTEKIESLIRTSAEMRRAINGAVTKAVNSVFQDPGLKDRIVTLVRAKF